MVQVLEQTADPETTPAVEATLNYIHNTGEKLFTYTGGPGSLDVRTGGTLDPQRVTIHNGRRGARLRARPQRLSLRPHDTKVTDFFDEDEISRVYYPEMEALVKAESGAERVVVFDHTLRTADDELREKPQDPRGRAPRAQRLYRVVGAAARARYPAGRGRRAARAPLRHHPGVAADPPPGRDPSARDLRCAQRLDEGFHHLRAPLSQSGRPDLRRSPTIRSITGTGCRACGATRRWCSRCTIRRKDGRARWTAHTAFDDPTTPPNARPRESIEIRTLAFFYGARDPASYCGTQP